LTKALAAEFAPKIRVNCIAPSITDTPLVATLLNSEEKKDANAQRHPLKKVGKPEDIAHLVGFLFSEKSVWITGQIIHADGGKFIYFPADVTSFLKGWQREVRRILQ
jgi:NAD(P)-dependent dehydrogenase (short-subunit alcohol dehydrogenase family)